MTLHELHEIGLATNKADDFKDLRRSRESNMISSFTLAAHEIVHLKF
jgi:hypothetical protein